MDDILLESAFQRIAIDDFDGFDATSEQMECFLHFVNRYSVEKCELPSRKRAFRFLEKIVYLRYRKPEFPS